MAANTADVDREAKGPAAPLPGVTAFIELTLFMLDEPMLLVDGDDETACSRPANMPNGCGCWVVVCGGGVGTEATEAGVDDARGVKSNGAPEFIGLLLFSLPLYR